MNTKILIIFIFFIPSLLFAQSKNDNTIIVSGTTLSKVKQALFNHGYAVAESGASSIKTVQKKLANHGTIIIDVVMKDADAYMSGKFENKVITPSLFKFKESYGGHYLGGSFDTLKLVASDIGNQISYAKL